MRSCCYTDTPLTSGKKDFIVKNPLTCNRGTVKVYKLLVQSFFPLFKHSYYEDFSSKQMFLYVCLFSSFLGFFTFSIKNGRGSCSNGNGPGFMTS